MELVKQEVQQTLLHLNAGNMIGMKIDCLHFSWSHKGLTLPGRSPQWDRAIKRYKQDMRKMWDLKKPFMNNLILKECFRQ